MTDSQKIIKFNHVKVHGRLIDANILKVAFMFAEKTGEWSVRQMRTVLEIIDDAPTIIPEERKEN